MSLRASQLFTRHSSLLPRRLPCSPRRCCCSSSFDEWLQRNALPSRHLQHRSSSSSSGDDGGGGTAAADLPAVRRFHAARAPALAAACLQRYGSGHLWQLEAPGVLVVSDSGSGSGLAARLELPRVLEGAHPALFAPAQQDASPLPISPAVEQQRLLDALASLAAAAGPQQGQGGEGAEPADEPTSAYSRSLLGQQLLVLLSADSAALAIYSGGALTRHKVLTGYTVRRQQGKAQAAYQRQGGGAHSVGGSIRARETRRLFQAAAATLAAWAPELQACTLLFRSGTVRVWNELYASTSPPVPIDRRDARWRPVGLGVRRPRLADAERAYAALSHGTLRERATAAAAAAAVDEPGM